MSDSPYTSARSVPTLSPSWDRALHHSHPRQELMATGSQPVATDFRPSKSVQVSWSYETNAQRVAGWISVASVVVLSLAVAAALVFPLWLRWTYDMNWFLAEPEFPAWSVWLPLKFRLDH